MHPSFTLGEIVMKPLRLLSTLVLLNLAGHAQAALVRYEFSTQGQVSLLPVADDAFADLIHVARGTTTNNVPLALRVIVDTDATPFVETDTSVLQHVFYPDAISYAEVEINGIVFPTIRTPQPAIVPSNHADEAHMEIVNRLSATQTDLFALPVVQRSITPLFQSYTVPFNQTIGGTFYDNVEVGIREALVSLSGPGLIDGVSLADISSGLGNAPFFSLVINPVISTIDGPLSTPLIGAINSPYTFSAAPVPAPAAVWLFGSGLLTLLSVPRVRGKLTMHRDKA
jgi:hypothetical protein